MLWRYYVESALGIGTALFMPPKSELNDLLQPIFSYMSDKHPGGVLIVQGHKADLFSANENLHLFNEKLIESFVTDATMQIVSRWAKDAASLTEIIPNPTDKK